MRHRLDSFQSSTQRALIVGAIATLLMLGCSGDEPDAQPLSGLSDDPPVTIDFVPDEVVLSWRIEGGCSEINHCGTWQVQADGRVTVVSSGIESAVGQDLVDDVIIELSRTGFASFRDSMGEGPCEAAVDGTDHVVQIPIFDEEIDTCDHDLFGSDHPLAVAIVAVVHEGERVTAGARDRLWGQAEAQRMIDDTTWAVEAALAEGQAALDRATAEADAAMAVTDSLDRMLVLGVPDGYREQVEWVITNTNEPAVEAAARAAAVADAMAELDATFAADGDVEFFIRQVELLASDADAAADEANYQTPWAVELLDELEQIASE